MKNPTRTGELVCLTFQLSFKVNNKEVNKNTDKFIYAKINTRVEIECVGVIRSHLSSLGFFSGGGPEPREVGGALGSVFTSVFIAGLSVFVSPETRLCFWFCLSSCMSKYTRQSGVTLSFKPSKVDLNLLPHSFTSQRENGNMMLNHSTGLWHSYPIPVLMCCIPSKWHIVHIYTLLVKSLWSSMIKNTPNFVSNNSSELQTNPTPASYPTRPTLLGSCWTVTIIQHWSIINRFVLIGWYAISNKFSLHVKYMGEQKVCGINWTTCLGICCLWCCSSWCCACGGSCSRGGRRKLRSQGDQ